MSGSMSTGGSSDDEVAAEPAAAVAAPKQRRVRSADAKVMVEGFTALLRGVLCEVMQQDVVDGALSKALKHRDVKRMLAECAVKSHKPKRTGSAYNMFVSVVLHNLREAGRDTSLTIASNTWANLPEAVKAPILERFSNLQELIKAKAGDEAGAKLAVHEELAAYEAAHGLAAFDYLDLVARYHTPGGATPKPPAPAAAAAGGQAAPKRAAEAASTPAAPGGGDARAKKHKSDKKEKKQRTDKTDKKDKKPKKDKIKLEP